MSKIVRKIDCLVRFRWAVSGLRWLMGGLLPRSFHDRPAARATLTRWLLLGLLLRLLFMPFAAHNDYLSEHWRAERVAFNSIRYPTHFEAVSHYLDALTLRIIAPFVPEHARLFWSSTAVSQNSPHAETDDYVRFAAYSRVNRALFLTKLPYLLFDLICALLLVHLFDDAGKSLRAFKYWMLNPAIIFAVYIFGRYEVYAALLILFSMLLLHRGRRGWGAVALGMAVLCRTSSLLLIPVYAMATDRRWSRRFVIGGLSLLPFVAFTLVLESGLGWAPAFVSDRRGIFILMLLNPVGRLTLYPFAIGYILVMMNLEFRLRQEDVFKRYVAASMFVYLLMLMFAWHSITYYAWIMPFLVWMIGEEKVFAKYFIWLTAAWALYWFVATDIGAFTPYLFSPISAYMQEWQPTLYVLERLSGLGLSAEQIAGITRSILAAMSGWMIVIGLRVEAKWLKK